MSRGEILLHFSEQRRSKVGKTKHRTHASSIGVKGNNGSEFEEHRCILRPHSSRNEMQNTSHRHLHVGSNNCHLINMIITVSCLGLGVSMPEF